MPYLFPQCQCGGQLEIVEGHSIEESFRITKAGKQAKKMKRNGRNYIINDFSVLRCMSCYDRYDYEQDNKGRVIIGDKYD